MLLNLWNSFCIVSLHPGENQELEAYFYMHNYISTRSSNYLGLHVQKWNLCSSGFEKMKKKRTFGFDGQIV
uniref:Uncharacterized protein n=1 Tax=Rhizophora mucronata TaxID=61149 RepID=A0A2P2MUF7_RHIMU